MELRERGIYRLPNGIEVIAAEGQGEQPGYVLYTRAEWDSESAADWEVDQDSVLFQGRLTGWTTDTLIDTGRRVEV